MHAEALTPADAPTDLKAALWDMDGTLVDSEPYWIAAEMDLVGAHGGHWSLDQSYAMVGNALATTAAILQEAGVALPIREIVDFLTASVTAAIRQEIPWRPGAKELLAHLHGRGVRCVLVTMSEASMAQVVVDALEEPYFEFMVTGDQVDNGKPHPEPYLRAIELLRASDPSLGAHHCVALEDSVPGVASALAALVPTIAIPHIVPLGQDPRRTTWDTLVGKTHDDVAAILSAKPSFDGAKA